MDKKIKIGLMTFIGIVVIGGFVYYFIENQQRNNASNQSNANQNIGDEENIQIDGKKTLVVYFSAQGHTKDVSVKIADQLNADLYEIVPKEAYTTNDLDWTDDNSRVSKEHDNERLGDIELVSNTVEQWQQYDVVLIGYPIWWGISAWPVSTFVKNNNFEGKTVIPFCTSSSSGLGDSGTLLADEANSGNWLAGHRFNSNPSDTEITSWTDRLK